MTVQKIVGDLFRKFVHDFLEFALYQNMGGSYGGTPIAGWFIKENPKQTWMIIGCTPISGNLHINIWWFPKIWLPQTIQNIGVFPLIMSNFEWFGGTSSLGNPHIVMFMIILAKQRQRTPHIIWIEHHWTMINLTCYCPLLLCFVQTHFQQPTRPRKWTVVDSWDGKDLIISLLAWLFVSFVVPTPSLLV